MMQSFRGGAGLLDLARGPGRLAQAMRIDFRQDGLDLCAAGPLWLATSRRKTGAIGKSVRIGLTRNVDRKLRFYEQGNPYVSGPKRLRRVTSAQGSVRRPEARQRDALVMGVNIAR